MTFWRAVAGVEAVFLLLLAWVLWRTLDIVAAQRRQLAELAVTLRLYREQRTDSDRQVRELLGQNERLARHLIDRAADLPAGAGKAGPGSVWIPPTRFSEARES